MTAEPIAGYSWKVSKDRRCRAIASSILYKVSHSIVLELFSSGLLSVWLDAAGVPLARPGAVETLVSQTVTDVLFLEDPDPTVRGIVDRYLAELEAQGWDPNTQGIWIQSGIRVLASHRGKVPVSAASITKVATSLAALDTWGVAFQFETFVGTTGTIRDGVLDGDLVITGSSDPLFVWEEAIALGNALNRLGITQVTGDLVVEGNFFMNFSLEASLSGELLREALNASAWTPETLAAYANLPSETPQPQVEILGEVRAVPGPVPNQTLLLRHVSLPMRELLQQMNIYSNNAMAEILAEALGGAKVVGQLAANLSKVPQKEIVLYNGSGLGANLISPRAACAMFQEIQRHLYPYGLSVADLFPMAGRDGGTVLDRGMPQGSVVKTGTLSTVSALSGALPTGDRGLVWFAILNSGWDLDTFRQRQDMLLQSLQTAVGTPTPQTLLALYALDGKEQPAFLGDPSRNQLLWQRMP